MAICINPSCNKEFTSKHFDALYCSASCQSEVNRLNAVKNHPMIPKSGIPGITFNRFKSKWALNLRKEYHGLFDTIEEADEQRVKILRKKYVKKTRAI